MKTKIALTITLVTLTGCMARPLDGEPVSNRMDLMLFGGFTTQPNQLVEIQIEEPSTQTWHTFATATTESTETLYTGGEGFYRWVTYEKVPRSARFWPASQGGLGTTRALVNGAPIHTGDKSLWGCASQKALQENHTFVEAYRVCDTYNGTLKEVSILAPCGIQTNNGCFDNINASEINDWPNNIDHDFSDVLQGITHDDSNWYFTSTANGGTFAKYPINANLENSPSNYYIENIFAPQWGHPGDADYSNGWVYVALEVTGHLTGTAKNNAIGAIPVNSFKNKNTYKTFNITDGPQKNGGTFPWIARDPGTNYFYSSVFSKASTLQRYKATFDVNKNPISFTYCGDVQLSKTIDRVQGGAFSPSGRLYISTDERKQSPHIRVIEMSGHLLGHEPINCNTPPPTHAPIIKEINMSKDYGTFFGFHKQEVEGITIWNLDNKNTYQNKQLGQIHTILINKGANDDFWLKHHRVNDLKTY